MCQWKEELLIIQEEMRQVLAFFEWRSAWWLEQANKRQTLEFPIESGVIAYAHKQSTLCLRMAAHCATYWLPVMEKHRIIPTWAGKYKKSTPAASEDGSLSGSEDDEELELGKDDTDRRQGR